MSKKVRHIKASAGLPIKVGVIVIVILAVLVSLFLFKDRLFNQSVASFDEFPIWLLRGGKVAVYREIEIKNDAVVTHVVVSNLGDSDQEDVKIYQSIPKEFAASAQDLVFNVAPEIIEDDPVIAYTLKKIAGQEYIEFSAISRVKLSAVVSGCRDPHTIAEMKDKKLDPTNTQVCLSFLALKAGQAQEKLIEEQQRQADPVTQTITSSDSQYGQIKSKAQKTISQAEAVKATVKKEIQKPVSTPAVSEPKSAAAIFPSEILGYKRTKAEEGPISGTCYEGTSAQKRLWAEYESSLAIHVIQYSSASEAEKAVEICNQASGKKLGRDIGLSRQGTVEGNPFWLGKMTYGGIDYNVGSYTVVDQYLIAVVYSQTAGDISEYLDITKSIIANLSSGPSAPTEAPKNNSGSCRNVTFGDLSVRWVDLKGYACSGWDFNEKSDKFTASCVDENAQYRIHAIKTVETKGASKLQIKANLTLSEPAGLFGTGVKYDDYVDLIALAQIPNTLSYCNKTVDSNGWATTCGISPSEGLGHCGVPKNSTSRSCDFTVETKGLNKIYLVLEVKDAWAFAHVSGTFSNVQVCSR